MANFAIINLVLSTKTLLIGNSILWHGPKIWQHGEFSIGFEKWLLIEFNAFKLLNTLISSKMIYALLIGLSSLQLRCLIVGKYVVYIEYIFYSWSMEPSEPIGQSIISMHDGCTFFLNWIKCSSFLKTSIGVKCEHATKPYQPGIQTGIFP